MTIEMMYQEVEEGRIYRVIAEEYELFFEYGKREENRGIKINPLKGDMQNPRFWEVIKQAAELYPYFIRFVKAVNACMYYKGIHPDLIDGAIEELKAVMQQERWRGSEEYFGEYVELLLKRKKEFAKEPPREKDLKWYSEHPHTYQAKSCVYIVRSLTNPVYYKIGRGRDYTKRTKLFSIKLPFEIMIEYVIPALNITGLEKELHLRFRDKRLGDDNEFFALTIEDIKWIKDNYYGFENYSP